MSVTKTSESWWFERGCADSAENRAPIFRKRGNRVIAEGEPPQDWTEEDEHEKGSAYLRGYYA